LLVSRKKLLLTVIVIVIFAGAGIMTQTIMNPISVISKKLQFDLPKSTRVLNYDYNIITDSIGAKVLLISDDLQYIENKLGIQFEHTKTNLKYLSAAYFVEKYKWWDVEKCNIEFGYQSFIDKEFLGFLGTQEEWVIISKENGQYYLYLFISY